jgi:hypothetical protein
VTALPIPAPGPAALLRRVASYGWWELAVVAALYLGYSATRLVASDDVGSAVERARTILRWQELTGFAWEGRLNDLFVRYDWLGVAASYQYASAHYVVTALTLLALFRYGRPRYLAARRALVGATAFALALYVALPVAPPRLSGLGHVDVLALNSAAGWWGGDASAPRGLGDLTNELAAMPSMHAGWSLWVALVVWAATGNRLWRLLALAHVVVTGAVVVGTGNHWVYDVLAGWLIVAAAWWLAQGSRSMRYRSPSQVSTSVTSSSVSSPERISYSTS